MTPVMETTNLTEIDAPDAAFWTEYQDAPTGFEVPPAGAYALQFPQHFAEGDFAIKQDKQTGKNYLQITIGTKESPAVIAEGPFQGKEVKYLRVDTRQIPNLVKEGNSWVTKGYQNASDAADVLLNFNTGDQPLSADDWKAAFKRLEGRTTPSPVYLTWGAYDKKAAGKAKYLKAADFPIVNGKKQSRIERTDVATGEIYSVFANLQVGRRGFSPKA